MERADSFEPARFDDRLETLVDLGQELAGIVEAIDEVGGQNQVIAGVELLEMERNRMDAWCCGAGGGAMMGNREYVLATGKERVDEAQASGAEALITSCPSCIQNLSNAKDAHKNPVIVQDIITLIHQSLVR